uniref:Uncharacterized protein n=1 Tax=Knipowitschia caucasica TaxID=637954 RepID=A0AAV2JPX5_KNICA
MEGPVDKSFLKGTVPCVFTFVPVVEKLTIKNSLETSSAASQKKQRENVVEVETTMSREQPFTNSERSGGRTSVQSYRNIARAPPHDPVFGLAPSFRDPSENISHGEQAPMEAAANKHTEISEQRYQCVPGRAPEHIVSNVSNNLPPPPPINTFVSPHSHFKKRSSPSFVLHSPAPLHSLLAGQQHHIRQLQRLFGCFQCRVDSLRAIV